MFFFLLVCLSEDTILKEKGWGEIGQRERDKDGHTHTHTHTEEEEEITLSEKQALSPSAIMTRGFDP